MTPSMMLEKSESLGLSYDSAASFVRYLRDRFGMQAVLELYSALDGIDARTTPDVFLAVLGEDWDAVEDAYLAAFTPIPVGSLHCDFPELEPEVDRWTLSVASSCEDSTVIGPFLGWMESDIPYSTRHFTLEIPEAGVYSLALTSSANIYVGLSACDEPLAGFSRTQMQIDEQVELVPGRKRLTITTDIPDEAIGELVLRGPLPAPPP